MQNSSANYEGFIYRTADYMARIVSNDIANAINRNNHTGWKYSNWSPLWTSRVYLASLSWLEGDRTS